MAGRKLKPKLEPIEVEENWIWGNHRGGGGAPLKDNDGNNVANLKKVMAGVVEVDHSPSPTAKRKAQKFRHDDEDDEENYSSRNNRDNRDDRDRNYRNNRDNRDRDNRDDDYPSGNKNQGNKGRGKNYAPDEVVYTPPKKVGYGSFTNAANHATDYEKEMKMRKENEYQAALKKQIEEKKRIKEAEKAEDERIKRIELDEYLSQFKGKLPAHLNPKAKGNDTSDERAHRNNAQNNNKGNNNSNNRRGGESDEENDYRESENQRRKPKFKEDNDRPPRKNNNNNKFRDDPEDNDDDYGNNNYSNNNNIRNNKKGNKMRNSYDRDSSYGDSVDNDTNNNDEDLSARNYNKKHNNNNNNNNNRNNRRGGDSDMEDDYEPPRRNKGGDKMRNSRDVVPRGEYDELSRLCDKLMDQQDAMHLELKNQAKVIEELKRNKSTAVAAKGVIKAGIASHVKNIKPMMSPRGAYEGFNGARSKSVQQARVPANKKTPEAEKIAAIKRPASMHTIKSGNVSEIPPPSGKPKVAFGGAAGGAAPIKSLKKTLASAAANSVVKSSGADRYEKIKTSPTKVAQAQAQNGFARLQLGAVKGPVVVTHEEEYAPAPRRGRREWGNDDDDEPPVRRGGGGGGGNNLKSVELKGKSEYIRSSANDDMITGDQLDRLLIQARKAKVGN